MMHLEADIACLEPAARLELRPQQRRIGHDQAEVARTMTETRLTP
jgi:hypothetical protein